MLAIKVAAGKIKQPAAELVVLECPAVLKTTKGFLEEMVATYFEGRKTQVEADEELMEEEAAAAAEAALVDLDGELS
jgi:succinylglutamate desuccinylase